MATFSERNGYKPVREAFQTTELDRETRVGIWNAFVPLMELFDRESFSYYEAEEILMRRMWVGHYGKPRDETPSPFQVWNIVKGSILSDKFNEVMDLLEALMSNIGPDLSRMVDSKQLKGLHDAIASILNKEFERRLVGYRLVNDALLPVGSETEIAGIEEASQSPIASAGVHIQRAVSSLSDRESPDFVNSIKESISAVESVARYLTGTQTLGAALTRLEPKGIDMHPALIQAWKGLYSYTSDAGGIRHGDHQIAKVDQAFAKYMLVTCSAFVTWLTEEARVAGKI